MRRSSDDPIKIEVFQDGEFWIARAKFGKDRVFTTSGKTEDELRLMILDAMMTVWDIPFEDYVKWGSELPQEDGEL